jgi:hypothetical protein
MTAFVKILCRRGGRSCYHFGSSPPAPWRDLSGEVPIEIEDKPTAVDIMRDLVEHLQDTIEALKREIARNRKSDEYRKALKSTEARLTIAKQILAREEARASHSP